jgi:hypothetical protein
MIAKLTPEQIRAKLDTDSEASKLLARVVCSTYWGDTGIDLRELDKLDADNFALVIGIMGHRRTPEWSDDEFYDLASWCRTRHHLEQWRITSRCGPGRSAASGRD